MKFARLSAVTVLALTLAIPSVYAAQPLPPGKPAGVKQANIWDPVTLGVITGGTALVVGFALMIKGGTSIVTPIAGGSGNSVNFTPTTTQ